ncbi:MAG: tetratricopeptide repeat protein [Terriglobia bacterium]
MKQWGAHRLLVGVLAVATGMVLWRGAVQQGSCAADLAFARQPASAGARGSSASSHPDGPKPAAITVDYPQEGSIFPPEITPPTFLWRDASNTASVWTLDVAFTDGSAGFRAKSAGEGLRLGEIDPRCVFATNKPPKLTPEQAAARTWIPDAASWETIKRHSTEHPATITISGFQDEHLDHPVSRGTVTIQTSRDPVGAPIFYRDVPLMPAGTQKGVIKPLPPEFLPLIAWRLRNIAEPQSRLLLTGLHTCANCHSFSRDGKTLGMDLDGPENDKGLYALASLQPEMSIRNQDVISWSLPRDQTVPTSRVGFMSQVSPDGRYVLTMMPGLGKSTVNMYVVNFLDYRFLQVFFPTRGILVWYDRATGQRRALPGADDPRYVQTDGVWSPDGKYVVFARAETEVPYLEGQKLPAYANAPEETPIRYDLYRIPFNNGQGGRPVPISGASQNGMSNTFPKVSPDGRWIVFVKCRNGQLMRPDSELYIVPAEGGVARRLRCNTPLMNSWHSFSPSGRWLVFSSKSRSPYTQMFLTHLDEQGNDSPAILIENATAANRAVNLPEFVNIPPDGLKKIDVPAAESYRLFDLAFDLANKGQLTGSIAEYQKVLELDPLNAKAHNNLGAALWQLGFGAQGSLQVQRALEIDPDLGEAHGNWGMWLWQQGKLDEAMPHLQRSLELKPALTKNFKLFISNLGSPASPPEGGLKLRGAVGPKAEEVTAENPSRRKRERLDAQYRQKLHGVFAYLLAAKGPGRGAEPQELSPDQPKPQEPRDVLLPPNGSPDSARPGSDRPEAEDPGRRAEPQELWPDQPNPQEPRDVLQPPSGSPDSARPGSDRPEVEKLIASLDIPGVRRLAEQGKDPDKQFAARRQILRIFLHTLAVSNTLLGQKRNVQALVCLEIAAQAAPTNPYVSYDMARVLALNSQPKKALKTLQTAARQGFDDPDELEGDGAFEGLRGEADYQKALAIMRGGKPRTQASP